MRQNENFILRKTADLTVILPVGEASLQFPGMISVNEAGEFLWNAMAGEQTLDSLAEALTGEYQVELAQARADAAAFVEKLRQAGALVGD